MLRQPSRGASSIGLAAGSARRPRPPRHRGRARRRPPAPPRSVRSRAGVRTGRPSAQRRACTGQGALALAAPGRARRLAVDRGDLVPAACSARSAGTAKSGLPMKASRMALSTGLIARFWPAAPWPACAGSCCASARRGGRRTACHPGGRSRAAGRPPAARPPRSPASRRQRRVAHLTRAGRVTSAYWPGRDRQPSSRVASSSLSATISGLTSTIGSRLVVRLQVHHEQPQHRRRPAAPPGRCPAPGTWSSSMRGASARTLSASARADRPGLGPQQRVGHQQDRQGLDRVGHDRACSGCHRADQRRVTPLQRPPWPCTRHSVPRCADRDAVRVPATLRSAGGGHDPPTDVHARRCSSASTISSRCSTGSPRHRRRLSALQYRADRRHRAAHHPRRRRLHAWTTCRSRRRTTSW